MKILECGSLDEPMPDVIRDVWLRQTPLSKKPVPRCFFPKEAQIASFQPHGFSDTSGLRWRGLQIVDTQDISLVVSKTKVAPMKRLTIEMCGAQLLSRLLHHLVQHTSHQRF